MNHFKEKLASSRQFRNKVSETLFHYSIATNSQKFQQKTNCLCDMWILQNDVIFFERRLCEVLFNIKRMSSSLLSRRVLVSIFAQMCECTNREWNEDGARLTFQMFVLLPRAKKHTEVYLWDNTEHFCVWRLIPFFFSWENIRYFYEWWDCVPITV